MAFVKMFFLSVQSLHAASPLLAVDTLYCLALEFGLNWCKLRVRVVIRRSRHDCDRAKSDPNER